MVSRIFISLKSVIAVKRVLLLAEQEHARFRMRWHSMDTAKPLPQRIDEIFNKLFS
jgi:hypothetical protein